MNSESPTKDTHKFVPFSASADGNEFYRYLSLAMYATHDGHLEVRQKIWKTFLFKTTGLSYTNLDDEDEEHAFVRPDATQTTWFCEWLISWYKYPDISPDFVKSNACARGVIDSVKENMCAGCPPPTLSLVAHFAVNIYGIVVVLFPEYNSEKKQNSVRQVWFPENCADNPTSRRRTKFVHLLKEPDTPLQMLIDADRRRSAIPTRAISRIRLSPTSFKRASSSGGRQIPGHPPDTAYKLCFFDPDTNTYGEVGAFSPPSSAADDERICTVHRISVDVRLSKRNLVYTIKHMPDARRVAIHIFSVQSENGKLYARFIGFWLPDFVEPRIFIKTVDMQIVVVPADNIADAERAIRLECGCMIATL